MGNIGTRAVPGPDDLTPVTGAQTDVAPIGRDAEKPMHERTADEDIDVADWNMVAESEDFRTLLAARLRFILPATIFFLVYYLALPLLAGFAKGFMDTKIIGDVNVAYLFALSQFIMTFVLAWIYIRRAVHFDNMAHNIVAKFRSNRGGK